MICVSFYLNHIQNGYQKTRFIPKYYNQNNKQINVTNILMFLKPTQMIALAAWDAAFSKELTDSGTTGVVGSAGTS